MAENLTHHGLETGREGGPATEVEVDEVGGRSGGGREFELRAGRPGTKPTKISGQLLSRAGQRSARDRTCIGFRLAVSMK